MNKLFLITIFAIGLHVSAGGQSKSEKAVLKLTKEYEEAIALRDASVHERLFAADYTYTPGNGNIMGRTEHMNFTRSGSVIVDSLRSEDVRARVFGDTAIVTGLWVSKDKRKADTEFAERKIRYILVFVRQKGHWQIVAEQRTGFNSRNSSAP